MKKKNRPKFDAIFQQGLYHIEHNTLCHDRAIAVQDGDLTILTLADGMGAEQYRCPDIGAQFAVIYVRDHAHEIYDLLKYSRSDEEKKLKWETGKGDKLFKKDLIEILRRMEDEAIVLAKQIGVKIDDMNCTLSFAVIGPEKTIQVAIGDSPIYVQTKDELNFVYGNGTMEIDKGTLSAYHMDYSRWGMDIQVGFTDDLESILIMSDGCLGYHKAEELKELSKHLPYWFDDIADGEATKEEAIQSLVNLGYDDCSFAYYLNDPK